MLAFAVACREHIQLGDGPDASDASIVDADARADAAPPTCSSPPVRTLLTTTDASIGELRAIAVAAGVLWVLSARADDNAGLLSRVSVDGGTLIGVATLGVDPVALALSADGAYAFAAVRGSAQIARVDASGQGIVTGAMGVPAGIVAGEHGSAYWTLPDEGRVVSWDFAAGAPVVVASSARATSIARDGSTIYVTGASSLHAFEVGGAPPRLVASLCGAGRPGIAGSFLFCADTGSIGRVDLGSGDATVIADNQPGASDVVIGGGRAFWRTGGIASVLMAAPIDSVSGPNVLEIGQGGALLIAGDDCSVYFVENRAIWRRGL